MLLPWRFESSERRELDLPIYSLTEPKSREKSTFVDSNHVDTILLAEIAHRKSRQKNLTIREFIKSEDFYEIIFNNCYNASVKDDKSLFILYYFNNETESYLKKFFLINNLGIITNSSINNDRYSASYGEYYIEIKLNENTTFKDIVNAYISELEKINLSDEDIKSKRLTLKKKINNNEN